MGCARLVTTMKIDDRRDKAASLEGKVTKALGRPDSGS
jgi:uncharacterized protein YqgV (UPF0045/DUF77 family)